MSPIFLFSAIAVVLVAGGLLFMNNRVDGIAGKTTLYELNHSLSMGFPDEHPYLKDLRQVSIWESHYGGQELIATTTKSFESDEFVTLVDELVQNGYVVQGGWNQQMEIKERLVTDVGNTVVVEDRGINTTYDSSASSEAEYRDLLLRYIYNRSNGTIYVFATMSDPIAEQPEE